MRNHTENQTNEEKKHAPIDFKNSISMLYKVYVGSVTSINHVHIGLSESNKYLSASCVCVRAYERYSKRVLLYSA